jgi:hypothetical protein
MVTLEKIALSANPNAVIADNANGIDGKVNMTTVGRMYVVLHFLDTTNIFSHKKISRVFMTDSKGNWPGVSPDKFVAYIGKDLSSQVSIVTREVEPYDITNADGSVRSVNTYTMAVFSNEVVSVAFARAGHPFAGTVAVVAANSTVEPVIESIG